MVVPEWTIADRLRKARLSAGLEQIELAEQLGAARTSVINYEAGRTTPRPYIVREWARITHVPADWLLTGLVPVQRKGEVTGEYVAPFTAWLTVIEGGGESAPTQKRAPHNLRVIQGGRIAS